MTLDYDPISRLQAPGYTEREATFLYLVAVHSGFFLRQQYLRFIRRSSGALDEQFLRQASRLGHIQSLAFGKSRRVYHLTSLQIYAACGLGDSHHRRNKADAAIKSRLMVLDFVLDHLDDSILSTQQDKSDYFTENRGLNESILPRSRGVVFSDEFPILINKNGLVRFTFFDEGTLSLSSFEKFLSQHRAVFTALPGLDLLYVADSERNIASAQALFNSKLDKVATSRVSPLMPRGLDHLIEYLSLYNRFEVRNQSSTLRELADLREGNALYNSLQHRALVSQLDGTRYEFDRIRQRLSKLTGTQVFTAVVLPHRYPLYSSKSQHPPKPKSDSSGYSTQKPIQKRQPIQYELFS